MIREERNALLLLLAFTAAAGLFYLLVLRPVLSDATTVRAARPETESSTAETAADPRPKAARDLVGLKAWILDAVSGQPLPAVQVTVINITDLLEPTVEVRPDGRLCVEYLPASISFGLKVECPGYRARSFPRLRNAAGAVIDLGLVAMEPIRNLIAKIRDSQGSPVGECVLSLFELEPMDGLPSPVGQATRLASALLRPATATARADQDGTARLESLSPGLYAAYVMKKSFGTVLVPDVDLWRSDRLLRIDLRPALPVRGTLQIRDQEAAVTNGRIIAVQESPTLAPQVSASITAVEPDGSFAHVGLSSAPHYLFVYGDQLAAAGYGPALLLDRSAALITARAGASLQGDVLDTDDLPVGGADVRLLGALPGSLRRSTRTNDQGHFEVQGLAPGPASLWVDAPGHAQYRSSVLVADETQAPVFVELLSPAELSGLVTSEGTPIAGAVVRCLVPERWTLTDHEGRYTLNDLPPGGVTITAEAAGHTRRRSELELRLRAENTLSFELRHGGSLRVLVRGADEVPISDARVLALFVDPLGNITGQPMVRFTDSRGVTRFEGIEEGRNLVVMARGNGYAPVRSQPFDLSDRVRAAGVALTLRQGASLDGTARDAQGSPLGDVQIRAIPVESTPLDNIMLSLAAPDTWSDREGRYSLKDLPSGPYRLRAERSGLLTSDSEPVQLLEDTLLTHFDFLLEGSSDLFGVVLDAQGSPAIRARVSVTSPDGHGVPADHPLVMLTDASGSFRFRRPGAGSLRLEAELGGHGRALLELEPGPSPPYQLVLSGP
ncbi:MAG: carboxypeptidase-like regulatory domain-containing protein [Planctomycetota bacterium]